MNLWVLRLRRRFYLELSIWMSNLRDNEKWARRKQQRENQGHRLDTNSSRLKILSRKITYQHLQSLLKIMFVPKREKLLRFCWIWLYSFRLILSLSERRINLSFLIDLMGKKKASAQARNFLPILLWCFQWENLRSQRWIRFHLSLSFGAPMMALC